MKTDMFVTGEPTRRTILDVPGLKVGHVEDKKALTGCTVVLSEEGAVCGVDVRGSAPGTRETDLLNPLNLVEKVHGICLSGGSAYGLDAATGVMRWLEEQGCGLDVGVGVVPIVPAAVLFDLGIGNPKVRPTAAMGYRAAQHASRNLIAEGNVGAGCGATVGKAAGMDKAMKSGLGTFSRSLPNGLIVGAVVAVNALGEVRDPDTLAVLAGIRDSTAPGQCAFLDSSEAILRHQPKVAPGSNTTLAVVACNAKLSKAGAAKVAQMAHDGLARTIFPVHTMYDGDTIFALATGELEVDVNVVGVLAAQILAQAVVRAVRLAVAAGGLPAHNDLHPANT